MAQETQFNGLTYIEPVVAVKIRGENPAPQTTRFGITTIMDFGLGAGYGGGKGSITQAQNPAIKVGTIDITNGAVLSGTSFKITTDLLAAGTTINLASSPTTAAGIVTLINTALKAANITDAFVYLSGNKIAFRSVKEGTSATLKLVAGTTDALVLLGVVAGDYTGTLGTTTLNQIQDFVYAFDDKTAFQKFVRGGAIWNLANPLFNPYDAIAARGVPLLKIIRAAETTSAYNYLILESGATLVERTIDEGLGTNGVLDSGKLVSGYAKKLVVGSKDTNKFKFQYYVGIYKGLDENGYLFDKYDIEKAKDASTLLFESNEFANISEFIAWSQKSKIYNEYFVIDTILSSASGLVVTADVTDNAGFLPFVGGSESYSDTAFNNVINESEDLNTDFILSTDYGDNALSDKNIALKTFIETKRLNYKPHLWIGGHEIREKLGDESSDTTETSSGIAITLNSVYVRILHEGDKVVRPDNTILYKDTNALHQITNACGYAAGLNPQDSLVYKSIPTVKPKTVINQKDKRESLIQNGVNIRREVEGLGFVYNSYVNTLQPDANLVYLNTNGFQDSISYSCVSMQIKEWIKKTLIQEIQMILGTNTLEYSNEDILVVFTNFLQGKVQEGVIVNFFNISIKRQGTAVFLYAKIQEPLTNEQVFIDLTTSI